MGQRLAPQLRRLFAAFLLLVLTLAQSDAALHHLTTRHVVCEEHGDFTHAGHAAQESAKGSNPARTAGIGLDSALASERAHAHCCVPLLGRYWFIASEAAPTAVSQGRSVVLLPRGLGSRADQREAQLYHFAPKTSPPTWV